MSRLDGDVAEIQRFAVDSLFSAVSSVIGLVVALAMLLTLSWKLSLLALVLIPWTCSGCAGCGARSSAMCGSCASARQTCPRSWSKRCR
jgi:hypothetical protein